MSRVLNGVPPEDAAQYRQAIQLGDIKLATAPQVKARAKKPDAVQFVEPRCAMSQDAADFWIEFDVPLEWDSRMYNTSRVAWHVKEEMAKSHHEAVWLSWAMHRLDEPAVTRMEFIRLGPGKLDKRDNLRAAFKYIVDAVCARIVHGPSVRDYVRVIGKADDILEGRGVTWTYAQQQYESNKRAHGARIRLHV